MQRCRIGRASGRRSPRWLLPHRANPTSRLPSPNHMIQITGVVNRCQKCFVKTFGLLLATAGLSLLGWSACSSTPRPPDTAPALTSVAASSAPSTTAAAAAATATATASASASVSAKRPPPERPPTQEGVHFIVHFKGLEVINDAEMGSGDWRVSIRVDGKPLVTRLMGEKNLGILRFHAEACSSGPEDTHRIAIDVDVDELDGGTWDGAGTRQERFGYNDWFGEGEGGLLLASSEGTVRLLYEIEKGRCPSALRTPTEQPTYKCQARCRKRLEKCGATSDPVDGNCLRLCERNDSGAALDCLDKRPCENMVSNGGRAETALCFRRLGHKPRKCAQTQCAYRGGFARGPIAWHAVKPAASANSGGGSPVDDKCTKQPKDGSTVAGKRCMSATDCRWHRTCSCPKGKKACVVKSFWARACVDSKCVGGDEACAMAIDESQYLGSGGPLCDL